MQRGTEGYECVRSGGAKGCRGGAEGRRDADLLQIEASVVDELSRSRAHRLVHAEVVAACKADQTDRACIVGLLHLAHLCRTQGVQGMQSACRVHRARKVRRVQWVRWVRVGAGGAGADQL